MVMEAPATSGIQVAPNPPSGPIMAGGVQMASDGPLPPRGRTGGLQQPTTFVPMQQMGQLQMGQQLIVQQQPQPGGASLSTQPAAGQPGQQQGAPSNIERIIGMEFVRQYYTMLHEKPHLLHRFYGKESFFLHGSSGEEEVTIIGSDAIKHKFEGMSPKECFTRIFHVDCQNSINNSVVVQVFGELTTGGESRRQFVQTFVLANQAHRSYYIINDIFRYVSRSSSPTGTTSPVGGVTTGSEGGLKGEEMAPVVQAPLRPRGKETSGGDLNGPSIGRPPSAPHPAAAANADTTDEASRVSQVASSTGATNQTSQAVAGESKNAASKLQTSYHSETGNSSSLTIATSSYVPSETGGERVRNASQSVASGGAAASSAQEAASDTSESKRSTRAPKAGKSESVSSAVRTDAAAVANGSQRAAGAEQPSKEDRTSPALSGGQQGQGTNRENESAKSRPSGPRSWANIAAAAPVASAVAPPAPTPAAATTTATTNEKIPKTQAAAPKSKQPTATVEAQTQAGRQSPTPGDPTIGEVDVHSELDEMQAGEGSPSAGDAGRSPYNEYRARGGRGPPPPTGDELYVTMLPYDWNEEKVFNFFTSLDLGVVTFARWPPERQYCFVRMESSEAAQKVLNYAKQFNTDKNDPTFRIPIPGMDPKTAGRGLRVELRRPGMGPQGGGGPRRSDMIGGPGGMMPRGRDREQRPGPPGQMFGPPPTRSSGGYARSGSGGRVSASAAAAGGALAGGRGSIGKPSA